jgi:hypothetical protein
MTNKTELKQKSRPFGRDLCYKEIRSLGGGFAHRLDAFGAEYLAHGPALFHHQGLLQVRFELAVGGTLGEGAVVTEGRGFSTICAFSHFKTSFLAIIPSVTRTNAFFEGTTFYHVTF